MNPADVARDVANPRIDTVQRGGSGCLSIPGQHKINSAQGTSATLRQEEIPDVLYCNLKGKTSGGGAADNAVPTGTTDLAATLPRSGPRQLPLETPARVGPCAKEPVYDHRVATVAMAQPTIATISVSTLGTHKHQSSEASASVKLGPPSTGVRMAAARTAVPFKMDDGSLLENAVSWASDPYRVNGRGVPHSGVVIQVAMHPLGELNELFSCAPPSPRQTNHPRLFIHQERSDTCQSTIS